MSLQPAIHVRDNGDGTMTARQMFQPEDVPFTFAARNYLTAAERYLANRWPALTFRKVGSSANAAEAIYHFDGGDK